VALTSLDECDPAGYVPCDQQAAVLSIPITDTNLALTYSSQWAAARQDRPDWNADSLGLGGWSINVLQRYDKTDGVLIAGDGSWRFATGLPLASGGQAVPSFDGSAAYVFDSAGRHIRTVDGRLGTSLVTLAYDPAGHLSSVDGSVAGQAAHLAVQRSSQGVPTALVGTDGAQTSLGLDSNGQLASVRSPNGATTYVTWAPGGLVTSETDPLGNVTRLTYDQAGRLTSSMDADGVGQSATRTATAASITILETTILGRVSTFRTESAGGGTRRTFIGPDGATTTETTNADDSRSITFSDGTTLALGAKASSAWGMSAPVLTPAVATRPDGVVSRTEVVQALASSGGLPYAQAGSITSKVNGQAWVQTFDPAARTITLLDPAGRKSVAAYDPDGHLVASSAPNSPSVTSTYDAQGRESSETVGTGAASQTTKYAFDASKGQLSVTRPDGSVILVAVDADGRAATTTAPDGSTVVTGYDADGRLTQVQPPGGLEFVLGSSPAGRPTAFVPPVAGTDSSAQVTKYDGDGEPVSVTGLGTRAIQAAYDSAGRVVGWTFDAGSGSASYDPTTHLLAQSVDPGGVTTTYGYAGSVLDKLGWSGQLSGSVTVTLDANGRAVTEAVGGSASLALTYDPAGLLSGVGGLSLTHDPVSGLVTHTSAGAVQTDQQYDPADRLIRSTTTISGVVVDDVHYTRDALGRIASLAETTAAGTTTTAYKYDGSDRLTSVTVNGTTTETDGYDAAGNRTSVKTPSGTTTATYDDRDRLVTDGSTTFTWAADGQLAKRTDSSGRTAFKFDDFGTLRGVTLAGGRSITYLVDADARRVGRQVGGKTVAGYLYDPAGHVVAETDGNGAVVMQFGYDDLGHLALVEGGSATYRVVTDATGSPRFVINTSSGALVDAITYDAWGRITSESAPGTIPFGFAGGLVDPDTGLVHFGARDYDPMTGTWTGPDPIQFAGGGANLYQYAGSDPVNNIDTTGLDYCTAAGPCYEGRPGSQPTTPPETPPANPPASAGAPYYSSWSCSGALCIGPATGPSHGQPPYIYRGGCESGSCGWSPTTGFVCKAAHCVAPDGRECVNCSMGDTHLRTGDGDHVDFQGAGEYIALMTPDGSVEVQARQEAWTAQSSVSYNTAVAANVDGDHIGVYSREPAFLVINGTAMKAPDIEDRLPHGGLVERHGGQVVVTWPNGSQLTVTLVVNTLNYGFNPSSAAGPTLRGLLGSADGNPANDLTGRDGVVLSQSDPAYKTKLYQPFGNSWRISQAESLFDYQPGESTATFTHLDFPSSTTPLASLDPATRASAEAICRAVGVNTEPWLDDCILDVGTTGQPAYAVSEADLVADGAPTTIPEPGTAIATPITIGQPVTGAISTTSQRADYTFTVTGGQVVYIEAQAACAANALSWRLVGPDGSLQGIAESCNDLGRHVLATAGIYAVSISSSGTATGTYAFTVLAVPVVQATSITIAEPVSGSVDSIGEIREYRFSGTAGEVVYLEAQAACAANALSWRLIGPDGTLLGIAESCNDLARHVLPAAGIYTVGIFSSGSATGPYAFTVLNVPVVPTSTITLGQAVTGSVDSIGETRDYTFGATAGEVVYLQAQESCAASPLAWKLLRPDGVLLNIAETCNDLGRVVLPAAGIYTIEIYSSGSATGPYAFTVKASQ
jgi:RHS repeat-associated protein